MKYLASISATVLLLIGCAGPSGRVVSPSSVQMTHSAYLGKSIMLFILDNGTPYAKKQLKTGKRLYAWNSRRSGFGTYIPRTRWNDEERDFMRSECEVRITTSSKGKILSIAARNSIRKNWDVNSCADYLK